jgi:protein-tyrosine-phosphatase/tRNA A37 threonylcarbamoyladenosine synthetase subunit TsaC/SUA5/YrdC
MPDIIDWQQVRGRRVGRYLTRALRRDGLLALPTQTTYRLIAPALNADAVARLRECNPSQPVELAVNSVANLRDWLPKLGKTGQRVARRLWPGPLTLLCNDGGEIGLCRRLPCGTEDLLRQTGSLRFCQPHHPSWQVLLRQLAEPVVTSLLPASEASPDAPRDLLRRLGNRIAILVLDGTNYPTGSDSEVEVSQETWQLRREGVLTRQEITKQLGQWIAFICTGNTCRSPLAEALCKKRLADRLGCTVAELPSRGYVIVSAGLAASSGLPAAAEAIAVAASFQADLTQHRSQQLSLELALQADHLLVMTDRHRQALAEYLGPTNNPPQLLHPEQRDIADPIGGPREVYEQCAQEVLLGIDALLQRLPLPD